MPICQKNNRKIGDKLVNILFAQMSTVQCCSRGLYTCTLSFVYRKSFETYYYTNTYINRNDNIAHVLAKV